ncbi:MAG: hypothetical protein HUK08_06580, partial [Bacteroidaceae bacterium]|nr:hypothetical protein [Bacteroidaceae bacterium]
MGKLFKVFFNTLLVVAILATIWIIVVYIPTVTASGDVVPVMEMSGFDVAAYYFYLFQNYFADYSWQVKTSYFIVFAAIVTMIILFFLFTKDVLARKAEEKRQNKIEDKYMDAFREILGNDILSNEEMIRILDANEIELRKNNPSLFVKLLAKGSL